MLQRINECFQKISISTANDLKHFFESHGLGAGDVILLCNGGHGFEVLEEVGMIAVKQEPYAGDADNTRFIDKTSEELS